VKNVNFFGAMKLTQGTLDKLSDILGQSDYIVRYERGIFQSGWCLLESKKVLVLSIYLDLEGKINTLLDLIPQVTIDIDKLTNESQLLYDDIIKKANLIDPA
jgi:hypothetical protein